MSVQLQAGKPVEQKSPKDVFVDALPKVFEIQKDAASRISATFLVTIFGDGGGAYFVDPKNGLSRERADGDAADCVLEMGIAEFSAMTKGTLDAAKAVKEGTMRFSGDPDQLVSLGALLGG